MKRIVLVNPNTSVALTTLMVEIARERAPENVQIEGLTAAFGAPLITCDAELDEATRAVTLAADKPANVAFLLQDDSIASLRIVVQDPATDAELYRSPADIPVRLGV